MAARKNALENTQTDHTLIDVNGSVVRRNRTAIQTEPVLSEANEEVDDSMLDDNYSTARDDNDRDEEKI